jgi:hypothetical protein
VTRTLPGSHDEQPGCGDSDVGRNGCGRGAVRGRLLRQSLAVQQRGVRQSGGRATPGRAAPRGRRRLLVPFTTHVRHDTVDGTGKFRSRPTLLMPPELGPVAGELRVLDRRLLTARGRAGRDAVGGVAFAVALAALVAEIVAWQTARGRGQQAAAARRAAIDATELVLEPPGRRAAGPGSGEGNGRGRARHGRGLGRGGPAAGRTAS